MQGVKVGDTIDAQDHGLAVEHEPLLTDLTGRLNDPGIAVRPVVAASGDQVHAVAVALEAEAVTVIVYLMESQSWPDGTVMDLVGRQK